MATIRAAEMALGQPFPPASAEMVSQGNFRAISTLMAPNRGGFEGMFPPGGNGWLRRHGAGPRGAAGMVSNAGASGRLRTADRP